MKDFTPAVFTREQPCTKVELQNCFFHGGKYVDRKVIEARTEIGINAPKFLIREGYVEVESFRGVDYYVLTAVGKAWLSNGILRYLELHPERALDCRELPLGYGPAPARKTPQMTAKDLQTRGRLIRRTRP